MTPVRLLAWRTGFVNASEEEFMSSTIQFCKCGALAALLALAPCAQAGGAPEQTAATRADFAPAVAPAAVPPPYVAGFGVAAAPDRLDSARGGSDGMQASAALRGAVTGNSASNVVTGANTIAASSFAGATGIPIVIQNSGANVLIQNATVINLQFRE